MVLELLRLFLGVLIAVFHRFVAARIVEQERSLDAFLRSRGIHFPAPLSDICLVQAGRIWLAIN
jgi:hypothetical protein